jgi:hypothetical protein
MLQQTVPAGNGLRQPNNKIAGCSACGAVSGSEIETIRMVKVKRRCCHIAATINPRIASINQAGSHFALFQYKLSQFEEPQIPWSG